MTSGSEPPTPIRAEIKAPKVDNTLDLEKILLSISRSTSHAADAKGADKPSPEVTASLKKISQLAKSLSQEMTAIRKLEPGIDRRIANVAPRTEHRFGQSDA
jgi:hypothetical protein